MADMEHDGHGAWRTWSMADMEHGYGGTSIAVAAVHYGSMAMGGTSIAVAAVHHKHDGYEAWLWGGPPSRSQRFTIGITGMKHGLAFLREKEGEKKKEKREKKRGREKKREKNI